MLLWVLSLKKKAGTAGRRHGGSALAGVAAGTAGAMHQMTASTTAWKPFWVDNDMICDRIAQYLLLADSWAACKGRCCKRHGLLLLTARCGRVAMQHLCLCFADDPTPFRHAEPHQQYIILNNPVPGITERHSGQQHGEQQTALRHYHHAHAVHASTNSLTIASWM